MKNLMSFVLILLVALSITSVAGEKKVEIKVDGMTCDGCVNTVKTSLEKVEGVKSATVSLAENSVVVLYDENVTDEASLRKTINSTGYKAVDAKETNTMKKAGCGEAASSCCGEKK